MAIYKDTPQNRKLKRVGMGYGKECSPCEVKKKEDKKVKIKKKPNIDDEIDSLMKTSEKEFGTGHASLAKNGSVLMAGEVMKKGNKLNIDSASGHYLPDAHCLDYLQKLLEVKFGYKYKDKKERQLKRFMKTTLFFEK